MITKRSWLASLKETIEEGPQVPREDSTKPTPTTVQKVRKPLEEAERRGLIIRWSEHPTWIKLHDPMTGEWHEVKAAECLPSVVETANKYRRKGARYEG